MESLPEDAAQRVRETPEYAGVQAALAVLRGQLEQAHRDLDALYALRSAAEADPVGFARRLVSPSSEMVFPGPQTVAVVPDVALAAHRRRLARRAATKYDQNLEYLVGRIADVQARRPGAQQPVVQATQSCPASPGRALTPEAVRRIFGAIIAEGRGRAQSQAPGHASAVRPPPRASSVPAGRPAGRVSIRQSRALASLPETQPPSGAEAAAPAQQPHAAAPWTAEERRRLDELLAAVPAERIAVRRYAKIAAALGTRTTSQVASRVQKMLRRQREAQGGANGGASTPSSSSGASTESVRSAL